MRQTVNVIVVLVVLRVLPCDVDGVVGGIRRLHRPLQPAHNAAAALGGESTIAMLLTPTALRRPASRRERAAKRVAEVFRSVIVDDRVHARVGVGQTLPDDTHRLHTSSLRYKLRGLAR